MVGLRENFQARIPSVRGFLARAAADRRQAVYDLLPVVSTPAARDRVARAIARFRPRTTGLQPTPAAQAWHQALIGPGITPLMPPLPAPVLADLRTYFESCLCRDPYRPHLGSFRFDNPPSPDSNMGYYEPAAILDAPHLLPLLNDPDVLATAELFLGCKPMIDNLGCWWSFGDRPQPKGTQRYHRDLDCFRGFKLFFYLSDVGPQDGPHQFIRGSQRRAELNTGRAQSEETIEAVFGADAAVTMTGPAGSRFMADTFGFHRGALPTRGRRLLLAAHYTINATPHLPRQPLRRPLPAGLDPWVNQLLIRPT